jgi:hypothetical protein
VIETVLVLPSPPALLAPRSAVDPVAELRAACHDALADVREPVVVVAVPTSQENLARGITEPLGHRVARHLLGDQQFMPELALPWTAASLIEQDAAPGEHSLPATTLLVMADGTARRGEQAPGHLHPDATAFDEHIEQALRDGDAETLATLDLDRAGELWCVGAAGFRLLGEVARGHDVQAQVTYADAPYGVAWWVARWDLARRPARHL